MNVTTRQRKALIDKIAVLTMNEHVEIFKIINDSLQEMDIKYTLNRNGMFINFKLIPDETVLKIEQFVDFCNNNRHDLDEYDKKINECKMNKDVSKVIHMYNMGAGSLGDGLLEDECDIVKESQDLQDVIMRQTKNFTKKNEWIDIVKSTKEKERVSSYLESLENSYSKIHKKKTCNLKYANAKKKFARKCIPEKKFDLDLLSVLEEETYIITA